MEMVSSNPQGEVYGHGLTTSILKVSIVSLVKSMSIASTECSFLMS
jgi:hypothetical protein